MQAHEQQQQPSQAPLPKNEPEPSAESKPTRDPLANVDSYEPSWIMISFMIGILGVGIAMVAYFGGRILTEQNQHATATETALSPQAMESDTKSSVDHLRYDLYSEILSKPHHAWKGMKERPFELVGEAVWTADSVQERVHSRTPTLFKESPLQTWELREVDLWNLSTTIPVLMGVVQSDHHEIVIRDERDPGGMLPSPEREGTKLLEGLYFWEFLYFVSDPSTYLFYSGPLPFWEHFAPSLSTATTWTDFRIIEAIVEGTNITVNKTSPSVWLSHPGVALQARYSEYHLIMCQVQGTSRFVLFPPSSLRLLYPYPHLHVHYQQSQVNFSAPQEEFPLFSQSEPMQVTLQAGDTLYIPPYWMYRFEAVTTSFMVEVPSASQEQLHLLEAYATLLPLGNFTTEEDKIVSAQVYLVHFLSRIKEISSPRKFVRALYRKRYSVLYPEDALFIQAADFQCLKDKPEYHAEAVTRMNREKVTRIAQFVADAVNDPGVPVPAKLQWAADYVELLARWAVGPEKAVLFLRECLSFEKLEVVEEVEGPPVLRL